MSLINEVLFYLGTKNYRRASFDRMIESIPGASTYDVLDELVASNPSTFRSAVMKRGRRGLALVDGYYINLNNISKNDEAVTPNNSAPCVTESNVNDEIVSEHYINVGEALDAVEKTNWIPVNDRAFRPTSLSLLTICIIVLKNGYTVTGKSACVSPALYNEELGRSLARKQAVQKIWPLLGFRLADQVNKPENIR